METTTANNRTFRLKSFAIPIQNSTREKVFIYKKDIKGVHIFSHFFITDDSPHNIVSTSLNTQLNKYAYPILKFLNYLYEDMENPLTDIQNLKKYMIKDFLNLYSRGELKEDTLNRWRTSEVVNATTSAITHFVYWLYSAKDKNEKKLFKMKYIKSTHFETYSVFKHINGISHPTKKKALVNMVKPEVNKNVDTNRNKVTMANYYSVMTLIEIAQKTKPMMVFGIALGAFAGLRVGQVCQMHRERLIGFDDEYSYAMSINFLEDKMLRSDNKMTSHIKVKGITNICGVFIDLLRKYYQEHMQYLINNNLNTNKYGALFLNKYGAAMMGETYMKNIKQLQELLYKEISEEVMRNNKKAIVEKELLSKGHFTQHSLRYFFTQRLDGFKFNAFDTAFFRGDTSLDSQKTYKPNISQNQIRTLQEDLYRNLEEACTIQY